MDNAKRDSFLQFFCYLRRRILVNEEKKSSLMELTPIYVITFFLLIVAIGIVMFVLLHQKKQLQYLNEKEQLKAKFDREILSSKLEIQEQTFNSISLEIHDNIGQVLSLAKVQLNILEQKETLDKTLLADTKESVGKAMTDLRDIAKSLNSERIQLSGLHEITGHELQRINRAGFMVATIKTEGEVQTVQEQKKLVIFRIIQEALHNIIKHSNAKNINVFFCYEKDFLKIKIEDNGLGFDKDSVIKNDGLGLHNMMNRAALIGGKAQINSTINEGTTITIFTPYA